MRDAVAVLNPLRYAIWPLEIILKSEIHKGYFSINCNYCAGDVFTGRHKDGNRMNIAQYCPPTIQYTEQYIMSIKRQFDTIRHTTLQY
jgi:hypothetical protein